MNTEALKEKLAGKLSLPSLPEVVVRLQKLVHDPASGMKDLGAVLAADPPLTARVLRIVNSAYYSLRVPVLDIKHAAAILGLDTLNSLVLQVGVIDLFGHQKQHPDFDPRELWTHSVLTARLAAEFPVRLMRHVNREEVYVCGLLHDIGKFVLFDHLREEFLEIQRISREQDRPSWRVEREILEFDHADVGGLVTARWGLPDKAIHAISNHHSAAVSAKGGELTLLITAANELAKQAEGKKNLKAVQVTTALLEELEFSDQEFDALFERSLELQSEQRS